MAHAIEFSFDFSKLPLEISSSEVFRSEISRMHGDIVEKSNITNKMLSIENKELRELIEEKVCTVYSLRCTSSL